MSFFDSPEYSSGILAQRLAIDAAQVNQTSGVLMGIAIRGMINIAAGYVIALVTSWPLGLISLSSLGVFILAGIIQLCMKKSYTQSQKSQEIAIQTAVEAVDNVYTITSLGVQDVMIRRHEKQLKAPYWRNIGNVGLQALLISSVQAILLAIVGVSLYVGAVIYNGPHNNNFEGIIRASGATLYTALIFKELFFNLPNTHIARQAASNILEIINTQPQNFCKSLDVSENHDNKPFNIKIANVSFSYPSRPDVPVLQHLTAQIPSGKTVALVGPSGSGKSTIISLMEQFYNVNGGMIFLNERNIFCKDVTWLRRQISLVSQEPVLFDMSISDNIRYGALFRDVTDDEVIEAAKLANIHNFIVTLPQGYDTYVGNKGTQLSGGQKQRIAIARALIRNPKILLLDEATSALDTESEKIVQKSLNMAREGRTTIIIAHRLSTIQEADLIVVIDDGRVVELGTHLELINQSGIYSNLIQNQTIDDEVKSESDDFNKAYRQSMRRRGMQRRKTSTNFAVLGRPSISHEPLERRSSQFPFSKRNTAMFASFTRRVSEGLVVVPEAVSPKIFSPHMSSFDEEEEDDVCLL
jgi:ABC-type multidrug transport system fused ATPase/permease subunit